LQLRVFGIVMMRTVGAAVNTVTTARSSECRRRHVSVWITCSSSVAIALVLRFSPLMGFVKDKIIAPLAGQAAKHTSPDVGHKAVDALGADTVRMWGRSRSRGAIAAVHGRVLSAARLASSSHWQRGQCW
jgi:hypothetical protein